MSGVGVEWEWGVYPKARVLEQVCYSHGQARTHPSAGFQGIPDTLVASMWVVSERKANVHTHRT